MGPLPFFANGVVCADAPLVPGEDKKVVEVSFEHPREKHLCVSKVEKNGSFNGALYSLKAFGIATALVVAGATASAWSVKTYLAVKDVSGYV